MKIGRHPRARRGSIFLEMILSTAVLLTMAMGLLMLAIYGCNLLYELQATLLGWPLL